MNLEMDSPQSLQKETQSCQHLGFCLEYSMHRNQLSHTQAHKYLGVWPTKLLDNIFVLFQTTKLSKIFMETIENQYSVLLLVFMWGQYKNGHIKNAYTFSKNLRSKI